MFHRSFAVHQRGLSLARVMLAVGLMVGCATGAPAMAVECLVNGDFETTPFGEGWSITPEGTGFITDHQGLTTTGLDASGTLAAWMSPPTVATYLRQTGFNTGIQWQLDMLFACEQVVTGDRSLNFAVPHSGAGQINMRIDDDGKIYVYETGPGWYAIADTVVSYSIDADDNGSFADAGDTLNVHSLRLVGDYGTSPYYDVYLSQANSPALQLIASNVQSWHLGNPSPYSHAEEIFFVGSTATGGAFVVDQVSMQGGLAEPSTELVNGDFEATPFDDGWVNGNGVASVHRGLSAAGLDEAGTQSALVRKVTGSATDALYQGNLDMGSQWQLDFLFASGEIAPGGTRSLNFTVYSDGGSSINIRLDPNGTLYAYDLGDTSWHQLSETTVSFSDDGNGDGDFEDAGDTLNVHSLRILGDYAGDSPSYDVYLSGANSEELELIASDVQFWHSAHPDSGDFVNQIRFASGGSSGLYLVDEVGMVSIPEPTLLGLLLTGGLALVCCFRKRPARIG